MPQSTGHAEHYNKQCIPSYNVNFLDTFQQVLKWQGWKNFALSLYLLNKMTESELDTYTSRPLPLYLIFKLKYIRCGRVVTDFLPYPKFSKSLLSKALLIGRIKKITKPLQILYQISKFFLNFGQGRNSVMTLPHLICIALFSGLCQHLCA